MDTQLLDFANLGRTPIAEEVLLVSGARADDGEIETLREFERLSDRVAAARLVY
ncbi:MAG: hypothetical protein NZ533_02695 [Casimicrobiaceae bacterium]|nr:hypothetical protein [Casimicrobiaceae bacterium]MDW8312713.1 hypothetical protein [Burkholderiales bacterium]